MSLLSIFMAMFTGAVVMMNKAENNAQALTSTSLQLNQAFLALDNTVRYASAISEPVQSGSSGDWYTEIQATNTGVETCTQLRVDIATSQLQRRRWTPAAAVSDLTAWMPLASGISTNAQPFSLKPLPANGSFQQLTISVSAPSGSGSSATTSTSSNTFTALNSAGPVPSAPFCLQQGRP